MRHFIGLLVPALLPAALCGDTPKAQPWPMDVVRLRSGAVLKGLIVEADERRIKFQCVQRRAGQATVVFPTIINSSEVDQIERLAPEQRAALRARLQELERAAPEGALQAVSWGNRPQGGWRYASDYFTLTSDAPEEVVRRAALRLEQVYVAYARYLPPLHKGAAPTSVLLLTDQAEYQRQLAAGRQQFLNLAFFDPAGNRIVCYSELQQLGGRLAAVRAEHKKLRSELEAKRAEYARLYKGRDLLRLVEPIDRTFAAMRAADVENDRLFARATRQLFATLYHEAFHAYLGNFVYPEKAGEPPRWLNEGLAQIFETAVLEGDELRVGHADGARLTRAKDALGKGELVPLAELLRSGPRQFALAHVGDRQVSDRHYLTSWALAFHLTFERRLLGTAALDRFIRRVNDGADPKAAFEELVGQPLAKFEAEFRKYLTFLQADGSVYRPAK